MTFLKAPAVKLSLIAASLFAAPSAWAGGITVFNTLGAYQAAIGGATETVETFTPSAHFPITSGILNSATTEAGLSAGDIQPGVTYSTPVGTGFFFNIDFGGGFDGGFLDGFFGGDPDRKLTVTFDNPTEAFGFETNTLAGRTLNVLINFVGGGTFSDSFLITSDPNVDDLDFFGFQSSSQDISSVVIDARQDNTFAFALDNFRFTDANGGGGQLPEPAGLALLGLGMLAATRRLRRL